MATYLDFHLGGFPGVKKKKKKQHGFRIENGFCFDRITSTMISTLIQHNRESTCHSFCGNNEDVQGVLLFFFSALRVIETRLKSVITRLK